MSLYFGVADTQSCEFDCTRIMRCRRLSATAIEVWFVVSETSSTERLESGATGTTRPAQARRLTWRHQRPQHRAGSRVLSAQGTARPGGAQSKPDNEPGASAARTDSGVLRFQSQIQLLNTGSHHNFNLVYSAQNLPPP
jgi:hypothetical protein